MARRRQRWTVGDVFAVPLADGRSVVGQVVGQEREVLNSVTVALFDRTITPGEPAWRVNDLGKDNAFSTLFTTRDLLDSGDWRVVGRAPVLISQESLPYENLRESGFVGARVVGSAIVNEFVNAFYGLTPWDDWKQPDYLDGLLVSPKKKPLGRLTFKPR